ncbi:hypothetical protein [Flavobacterium sp.]|uniref:hypothetical protein n=1 Tax=Flavobacterium sp. TaxID=239 RepID=UPI00374DBD16
MKKIILVAIFVMFSSYCKADQLQIITKEQAIKAVELIKKQEIVVVWCSCCESGTTGAEPQIIAVRNVYYKIADLSSSAEENYIVVVQGVNLHYKIAFDDEIDLAYTHIGINDVAYTVAQTLRIPFRKCNDGNVWSDLSAIYIQDKN